MIDDIVKIWLSVRPNGTKPEAYESIVVMIVEMMKLKVTQDEQTDLSIDQREVGSTEQPCCTPTCLTGDPFRMSTLSDIPEVILQPGASQGLNEGGRRATEIED